jgi:hypothetical protein
MNEKSKVFYIPSTDGASTDFWVESLKKICKTAHLSDIIEKREYCAIKVHVGEKGNTTYTPPELAKVLVDIVKKKGGLPFLTETSTLYRGERDNAVSHIIHGANHGYSLENTGAPFIMADGLTGDSEISVPVNGELFSNVFIAREARMADVLIVLSHMTGHLCTGFGATLKNLGMGLASRKGKLRQHSKMSPEIDSEKCVKCLKCIEWCPEDAIGEVNSTVVIDKKACIGCGECLAVCHYDAVKFDWAADNDWIQKAIAEHASGAVAGKKAFYINFCCNMTKNCDCMGFEQDVITVDAGILASSDPVALDQASIDISLAKTGENLANHSHPKIDSSVQLDHGEKIGLGTRQYELITINT